MKIGIDIDGVILDSEREFRIQSELYDVIKLNRNSIIDNKELKVQARYEWSEQELYDFKPIIENVIYDGLNYQLEKIKTKHGGEKCE